MGRIEGKNLTYRYEDGFTALDDLDFTIEDGEFICVVGHSGCGKTTLLRLISGLALASSGELTIDGTPIVGPGLDRAVVFQQYSLFAWKTALKNVEFGLAQAHPEYSKEQIREVSKKALESVGMGHAMDFYPYQLSGGMKQRVAIARAFVLDSGTLLLDEPFGALDQYRRSQLQKMLLELWASGEHRKTVIFVTHDIDEAILLADRIFFMRPGRIERVIDVDFDRPRDAEELASDPHYGELRRELLRLFSLDVDALEMDREVSHGV
ncbi:MAG: ABC transporter ATP-binding protein [Coriobacteriales bacterium]